MNTFFLDITCFSLPHLYIDNSLNAVISIFSGVVH